MKTEAITTLVGKILLGVSTATVIGGGSMVLTLHRNDAVQDVRIERNERTLEKIDALDDKLDVTLRRVDILNARLETPRNVPRQ